MSSRSRDVRDLFFKQRIHEDIMALPRDEPDREWKAELLRANIPRHLWEATLDDFGGNEEAARLTQEYCTKIEEAFEKGFGLLYTGRDGVGEATLVTVVLKEAIRHGYSGFFITFPQLIGLIHRCFEFPELWAEVERITRDTQFLAIAEAGRDCDGEGLGDFALSELEAILRHRGGWLLPTLLATELEKCELQHVYEDSLMSVISARLRIVDVGSPPKRRQTMEQRTEKKALTGKKAKKRPTKERRKLRRKRSSNADRLRPCVRLLLTPSAKSSSQVRKHLCTLEDVESVRRLIIGEARRLKVGEKQAVELLRRFFTTRFQGLGEEYLKSKVTQYVHWAYAQKELPMRCCTVRKGAPWLCDAVCEKAPDGECPFSCPEQRRAESRRAKQQKEDRFEELGWPALLRKQYSLGPLAATICSVLRELMVERDLDYDAPIFVSYRSLIDICEDEGLSRANRRSVSEAVTLLVDHGLIEKAEEGKRGANSRMANGYRICLPTPVPPRTRTPEH